MHPRIQSHRDARAVSPAGTLGVAIGSPRFAGTAARTAHAPSADAQQAPDSPASGSIDIQTPAPGDLAPFAPSPNSPTDGERVEPVGTPADDGLGVESATAPGAAAARLGDGEGSVEGGSGNADMVDVIPAIGGAAPADAATWGGDAD